MKLHDLRPAPGSRKARTRVGRGIAAGQGKTAGRGTKGQKARAGASIPAWFEGGQTPIHIRVPKLRGFRNAFKIEFQVVNIGRIAEYAAAGRFGVEVEAAEQPAKRAKKSSGTAPISVNPSALASAGLISSDSKPVKVLGGGDIDQPLFVAADAFTASARSKIESAGGFVQLLNVAEPVSEPAAEPAAPAEPAATAEPEATAEPAEAVASAAAAESDEAVQSAPPETVEAAEAVEGAAEPAETVEESEPASPAKRPSRRRQPTSEE